MKFRIALTVFCTRNSTNAAAEFLYFTRYAIQMYLLLLLLKLEKNILYFFILKKASTWFPKRGF
jgi:hypothetical protein